MSRPKQTRFSDDLHAAGLRPFDLVAQANLPDLNSLPEAERLATLRDQFEELSAPKHPLQRALDQLQSLDVVKIIEGKGP